MASKADIKPQRTRAELRKIRSEAGRKGGFAKAGHKSPVKLLKDAERELGEQFFMRSMRGIRHAQVALAKGLTFLYVIKTDKKGNRSKPEVVTDQYTIEQYLADELDDDENEYYYLATKEPNSDALKDIQNRVFGKPKDDNAGLNLATAFSLLAFAQRASKLAPIDGNKDVAQIAPELDTLPHPRPSSEE